MGNRARVIRSVAVDSIVAGQGSDPPVGVVSDDDPVAADLRVSVLFRQGEAQVPRPVGIGSLILPGGGRADHIVAGHLVSVRLVCFSLQGQGSRSGAACATPVIVTPPSR
jgi:hypothetical protein